MATTHLILGILLQYLGKMFLQIFSIYGIKCKQIAFKCTDCNSSTRVTVYSECIYVFYQHIVTEYHVDC